jgi:hypothetical protein
VGVDARRFLTRATGCAATADALAKAVLRGIRRNRAVIPLRRSGLIWRAARLSPRLTEQVVTRAMQAELERTG